VMELEDARAQHNIPDGVITLWWDEKAKTVWKSIDGEESKLTEKEAYILMACYVREGVWEKCGDALK